MESLGKLLEMTALEDIANNPGVLIMLALAIILLYLGIFRKYEPLLLIPIGFGVLLANIPGGNMAVITTAQSPEIAHQSLPEIASNFGIMNMLYYALIKSGLLPPLIFLGVGAMTDFGPMLRIFWRSGATRYFHGFTGRHSLGFYPAGSRCTGYHRRGGWTDGYLYQYCFSATLTGTNRHCRL